MIFLLIAGIQIHTMGQGTPVITDHLSQQMENTAAGDLIRINITLAERIAAERCQMVGKEGSNFPISSPA